MFRNQLKVIFQKRTFSRMGRTVEDFKKWKEQNNIKKPQVVGDIPNRRVLRDAMAASGENTNGEDPPLHDFDDLVGALKSNNSTKLGSKVLKAIQKNEEQSRGRKKTSAASKRAPVPEKPNEIKKATQQPPLGSTVRDALHGMKIDEEKAIKKQEAILEDIKETERMGGSRMAREIQMDILQSLKSREEAPSPPKQKQPSPSHSNSSHRKSNYNGPMEGTFTGKMEDLQPHLCGADGEFVDEMAEEREMNEEAGIEEVEDNSLTYRNLVHIRKRLHLKIKGEKFHLDSTDRKERIHTAELAVKEWRDEVAGKVIKEVEEGLKIGKTGGRRRAMQQKVVEEVEVVDVEDREAPAEFKPIELNTLKDTLKQSLSNKVTEYHFDGGEDPEFQKIVDALTFYRHLHGDFNVPRTFRVPKNSEDFPPFLWNFRLGEHVPELKIRGGKLNTEERRQKMKDIGFDLKARG